MTEANWVLLAKQFVTINQNLVVRLIMNGLKTQFLGRLAPSQDRPEFDRGTVLRKLLDPLAIAIETNNGDAAAISIAEYFDYLRETYLDLNQIQ
jgi:DNA-binding FadR family transcriptional regulator